MVQTEMSNVGRSNDTLLDERELRQVFHSADDAIFVHDGETGEIIDVNERTAEMYGYPREAFREGKVKKFSSGNPPYVQEEAERRIAKAMDGEDMRFEWQAEDSDGEMFWVEVSLTRTVVDDEPRIIAVVHDIDDKKRYEQQLEEQNRRLEQFASLVSHDLRNPLTVAQLRIDMVDGENAQKVEQSLNRMERIVEDVLTMARGGQAIEETRELSIYDVASQAWKQVQTAEATLTCEGESVVEADPGRCKQLFENLFRNSIEHAGEDVTIRIGPLGDGFYVEDDGPGFETIDEDELFEVGYSTKDDGTGLGLNIVEEIATAHDWAVTVENRADAGARFEFVT
jgi:PAS domain S-box-containing protein